MFFSDRKVCGLADRFIKVFGERNTGTRALIQMLGALDGVCLRPTDAPAVLNLGRNAALRAQIDQMLTGKRRRHYRDAVLDMEHLSACPTLAWKHAAPIWDDAFVRHEASVIFMVRNPYAWAVSLARRPYHRHDVHSEDVLPFVCQPWLTLRRDNLVPILASPMDLWNLKTAAYMRFVDLAGIGARILKFEDFVNDPVAVVRCTLDGFGICGDGLQPVAYSTKDQATPASEIAADTRREIWRDDLNFEAIQAINERVDWDVANSFGYWQLDPKDFQQAEVQPTTSKNLCHTHSLTSHSGFQ